MRSLPDNNLYYPVLLEFENNSGSGFFLNYNNKTLFLVSAYHVIFSSEGLRGSILRLTYYGIKNPLKEAIITINIAAIPIFADRKRDVAILYIGDLSGDKISPKEGVVFDTEETITTVAFVSLKKFDKILDSNDVFVSGYPSSLGVENQIEKKRPLLRKGIVAGKNYINKTIILDCPVYFGNSGGLAIEVEQIDNERKFSIIGIVVQHIPFVEKLVSQQMGYINTNIENSGYSVVVPADVIEELLLANNF